MQVITKTNIYIDIYEDAMELFVDKIVNKIVYSIVDSAAIGRNNDARDTNLRAGSKNA